MAYAMGSGGGDSKLPWIIGGLGLVYLWYEGYLATWFPSIFGASLSTTTVPYTSVATGSVNPTLTQVVGTPTINNISSPVIPNVTTATPISSIPNRMSSGSPNIVTISDPYRPPRMVS